MSPLGPLPQMIVLKNLLTGVEEKCDYHDQLVVKTNRYPIIGFYPESPETSLNIGLFPLTDHTYRLEDKLGCQFQFDEYGRLVGMLLADHLDYVTNAGGEITGVRRVPDYEVKYEYARKKLSWRYYSTNSVAFPFRLAPAGNAEITVRDLRLPQQLRLFDAALGTQELFDFATNSPTGALGYVPADKNGSGYTFLAVTTDGSFLLEHKSGTKITFDQTGVFRYMVLDIVKSMIQNPYEVRFEYGLAQGQYRIIAARVFAQKTDKPQYAVIYKYAPNGNLAGTYVVSAK